MYLPTYIYNLYMYMYLSTYLSIYLPICLSVCLSVYLSMYLFIYLSIHLQLLHLVEKVLKDGHVPPLPPKNIQRVEFLKLIRKELRKLKDSDSWVVIYGLPGFGKYQVACNHKDVFLWPAGPFLFLLPKRSIFINYIVDRHDIIEIINSLSWFSFR